ncbi:class I SAM-dependent methyltransferase [Pendulispora albinea]|uniref:Methyltransferase domain-containing protein n=1 Tax=Pendulispora albinea TaxID=2741071 RepID=A0ABZ2M8D1_9BACT
MPTPIAPPVRPASYSAPAPSGSPSRTRLRDLEEDSGPSRRVRPRMTLRIPDDEVARPLSAPPPEASPQSRPEIAPMRLEPPPPPSLKSAMAAPARRSDPESRPAPKTSPSTRDVATSAANASGAAGAAMTSSASSAPVVPRRSEIPPRSSETAATQRVEIAPQRIITINAPAGLAASAVAAASAPAPASAAPSPASGPPPASGMARSDALADLPVVRLGDTPPKTPVARPASYREVPVAAPVSVHEIAAAPVSPRDLASGGGPPSPPPDTEPLPSPNDLTLVTLVEEAPEIEVEPIAEIDAAPTPRDASAGPPLPVPPVPAPPLPAPNSPRVNIPPRIGTIKPVIADSYDSRSQMLTIPDSDGGLDIPVVEDEDFARPSAPELEPDDLVSIESEPNVEARPRIPPAPPTPPAAAPPAPPPAPPAPPPPISISTPVPSSASPVALSPPSPSAPPVREHAAVPIGVPLGSVVAKSLPPPSGGGGGAASAGAPSPAGMGARISPQPVVPMVPGHGMSSTPDLGTLQQGDEHPIADVIGPAPSELAPPPLSDATVPQRKRTRPWWEELFNDDFIRTMAKVTDAQIAAEADFIEDSLAVAKGAMVLDLACGTGRHAIELTRRGYQVVGYDLSLSMLARAADEAQDRNQKLNFVQGDMREMTFEETFDGIYSWNTSFGFFDEDRNAQVISRVHRALRKGGQFLLDVVNRDYISRQAPSLAWFEGEGCVCMDEMTIDWITSRMRIKRTMMMDDGRSKEIEYSIRIYSLHELGKMLHDHGFRVAEVSGRIATPGVFFGTDSPRTLILAEKRA